MFHVSLSLSIAIISARNAWGAHLGPYYLWEPHRGFANDRQCPGCADSCGPYYDCKRHLSNSHRGNLKKLSLSTHKSWRIHCTPGPHIETAARDAERACARRERHRACASKRTLAALGSVILGSGVAYLGFHRLALIGKYKTSEWELKRRKVKTSGQANG